MDKLFIIQTYFNGAFEMASRFLSEEKALQKAYQMTKEIYVKQPIYRSTIEEFDKWFQNLLSD